MKNSTRQLLHLLLVLVPCFSIQVFAQPGQLEAIRDIRYLFAPVGFDDNDEVLAVVDGYLDGACYQLRQPRVDMNPGTKQITITPMAFRKVGPCPEILVPFSQVVYLGQIPAGSYTLATKKGEIKESLAVKVAATGALDEYLYAPIDSVHFIVGTHGETQIAIRGRFTDSCLQVQEVKLDPTGKTLQVLPILKKLDHEPGGLPCATTERNFEERIPLPELPKGRYLLHVRSLNGQAINEVFSVPVSFDE